MRSGKYTVQRHGSGEVSLGTGKGCAGSRRRGGSEAESTGADTGPTLRCYCIDNLKYDSVTTRFYFRIEKEQRIMINYTFRWIHSMLKIQDIEE